MHSVSRGMATAVIAVILGMSLLLPRGVTVVQASSVPAGLPTHFGLGVSAAPDSSGLYGWMPNSGIGWDYAYQYLSGGVNTTGGWSTWNTSGQFPLYYAQGAATHNYIPVFSYYNLLQSNGTCGTCGEAQKDLSNLNNTGTMASYFADFRLLMQRLGSGTYGGIVGFGKTAIVHVEPDLSGYAEQAVLNNAGACSGFCTAQGNDPSYLTAAVAATGDADVQGYPNTYQGFNWALLHLRDLYAPNVRLAFHVSNWATTKDIGSDTSSTLDAGALGQEVGSFAAQSGTSSVPAGTTPYDLLFNDVSDRDAGYYKYVYNNPNVFWDRLNVSFPNFHRWESYVSAAGSAAGRSVIIWQIPEGNQYFATDNNTNGHYQDNRAEYFFSHVAELANAGIIGLLFGAGNGGSTVHTDGMNDGVTNPPSFCTTDGLSSGQICNNHTSTVSDDDGGYIRLQAQQYYTGGGYPLSSGPTATPTATNTATVIATATATAAPTATATPGSPTVAVNTVSVSPATVVPGNATTLSTTVTSSSALSGAIVDFEIYDSTGTKVYQASQSPVTLVANTPLTVTVGWSVPAAQPTGPYTLKVGVFGSGWAPLYVWDDVGATITVAASSATNTPTSTGTPNPTATDTPAPTATNTPTNTPAPTATFTPMPTATATNTAIPTATPTVAGVSTLGLTGVGAGIDRSDANSMHGSRIVTGAQNEMLQSISAYVGSVGSAPNNQYSVAIYTDSGGRPSTLVARSSAGTLTAKAWNTLLLSATLTHNTAYWLMYNTNGNSTSVNNLYFNSASTSAGARSGSRSFGNWPTSFGSSTLQSRQYSLYATVNP